MPCLAGTLPLSTPSFCGLTLPSLCIFIYLYNIISPIQYEVTTCSSKQGTKIPILENVNTIAKILICYKWFHLVTDIHSLLQYNAECAESNAIMNAFKVHADLRSSILYVTSPLCSDCAKIAVQSGVKAVVYAPSNEEEVEQDKAQETKQDEVQKKKEQEEKEAVKLIFNEAGILYR